MKSVRITIVVMLGILSFRANAWMDAWAPEFVAEPVKSRDVIRKSVSNYVEVVNRHSRLEFFASCCGGSALDLNGNGIEVFVFGSNGVMRCANADFGTKFPAVTIYYTHPKFRQVELAPGDLEKIADKTKPHSHKYTP